MAAKRLDWNKESIRLRMLVRGSEPVDGHRGPQDSLPTRSSDLVRGVTKSAMAANKAEHLKLKELKENFARLAAAPDFSSLELDKLRRHISRLERSLPPEKRPSGKRKRSEKKPKVRKKNNRV
jgi:hypothetical protein